jgi:hypothetical protein
VNADHLTTMPGRRMCAAIPHLRGDGEEMPFAGNAFERVSAALLELES